MAFVREGALMSDEMRNHVSHHNGSGSKRKNREKKKKRQVDGGSGNVRFDIGCRRRLWKEEETKAVVILDLFITWSAGGKERSHSFY